MVEGTDTLSVEHSIGHVPVKSQCVPYYPYSEARVHEKTNLYHV